MMKRLHLLLVYFLISFCSVKSYAQTTFPNPSTLSTGQGTQGSLDPLWTVSDNWYYANPPNPMGLTYSAALINGNCAPGSWVDPTTLPVPVNNGNWITGADAPCNTDTSSGYRYFRLTLNLPADCNGNSVTTPGVYVLNLTGYVDNVITDVFVNGTSTGISGGSFSAGNQLNITLNGPWVAGVNYVDIQVFNGHEFPPSANPYGLLMVANTNTPTFYCSPYAAPNSCNTNLIRSTLVGAGNTELQGMDNTCSLYFINPQYMDGPAAQAYAQTFGANLISVQSAAENTALTTALSNQGYAGDVIWIGFIRTFPGGPFVWSDSSAISYTNWAPGEPNNAGGVEGCTQIYANGGWNDLNCTGYNSLSVIEVNLCPVTTIRATQDTICKGQNSTLVASTLLGASPYNFTWTSVPSGFTSTSATITPSPSVTTIYNVTSVDRYGCTSTTSYTIYVDSYTVTPSHTNVTCFGLNNGTAALNIVGGLTTFTYAWSPSGGAAATATGLSPQTYVVSINDKNNCPSTVTITITQPPVLSITATATNVTCFGLSNGSVTGTASGGVAPYLVGINSTPPQGGPTLTGVENFSSLPAGNYTVGVQDANACPATFPITITQPPILKDSITTSTNVSCYGGNNGSATAGVTGGTMPYLVGWSNNTFAYTASMLTVGTYTFGVQDAHSCQDTVSITITQPAAISASIPTQTNVSCFGLHDGDALATVSGGANPYSYLWSNGNTSIKDTSLAKGIYTFTVTDANNCTDTASVTITQPPILKDSITTFTNVSCFGLSDGSATAGVTGGTQPYLVGWSNNQFAYTASSLAAGTYTFGVQDAHGCQDTVSITITQPLVLKDSITSSVNVSCFGLHNGSATGGVTGGTTPYTYLWSNGNNLIKDTALVAGTYTLLVTDAHSCRDTVSVNITQPLLLKDSTITFKNDSCFGDNNGSATAVFVGGTLPYTYLWSNGNTTANDTLLVAGNYMLTTTDAHGCVATTSVTINQPPKLTVTSTPKLICISNTTTLTALAIGGNTVQPYSFLWSNNAGSVITNTAAVSPVITTTYSVKVKDIKDCSDSVNVTVFVRDSLKFLAVSPSVERCPGFSATLNATGNGGDSTFTYTWKPGSIASQNVTVTPAATTIYTVTLSDACGTPTVTAFDTVTINPLPQISFTSDVQSGCYPLCVTFTNSTTIVSNDNITYNWNLGAGHLSTSINPYQCYTTSGIYTVSVTATSVKGCISKQAIPNMITVYPHPKARFNFSPQNATIIDPTIQFTDASTAPGSSIGGILWQSFGDGSDSTSMLSSVIHTYKDTGTFCVTLIATNVLGCKDTTTECVIIKPFFTVYIPNSFTPNGDGRNEVFNASGDYISTFDMKIFDRWGNLVYHSTNFENGWNGTKNGTYLQEDVYVYVISVTDPQKNPYSYNGTVTLIR